MTEEERRLTERVLILEHTVAQFRESLQIGAKRFTQIDEVLRPSIAKVAAWLCGFLLTAGIPIAVFLISLGKYPDAETFVKREAEYAAAQKTLDTRVQALEVTRAEQEIRLRAITETLSRVESKIDTALAQRRRAP